MDPPSCELISMFWVCVCVLPKKKNEISKLPVILFFKVLIATWKWKEKIIHRFTKFLRYNEDPRKLIIPWTVGMLTLSTSFNNSKFHIELIQNSCGYSTDWGHWVRQQPKSWEAYQKLDKACLPSEVYTLEHLTRHKDHSGRTLLVSIYTSNVLIRSGSRGDGGWPELGLQTGRVDKWSGLYWILSGDQEIHEHITLMSHYRLTYMLKIIFNIQKIEYQCIWAFRCPKNSVTHPVSHTFKSWAWKWFFF